VLTQPKGLRARGREVWVEVTRALDFDAHELAVLTEACRAADRLDALDRLLRREGLMVGGRTHPALAEARQTQIALARLLAALRLPADLSKPDERPQRRHGARGVYTNARFKVVS